jgi:hypothetical protein
VLIGLSGFQYNGPEKRIGFSPRITPAAFKAPFTAAEGWGTLIQEDNEKAQRNLMEVKWGLVPVKQVVLSRVKGGAWNACEVRVGNRPVKASVKRREEELVITLSHEAVLTAGQALEVIIS